MSSAIDPSTGESMQQGRSPRFTLWVAFLVFAAITMGSAIEVKQSMSSPNSAATWAVAGSAVTFGLTFILVVCHLWPVAATLVIGTRLEGFIIFVLACFWAGIVAVVTDANNSLGVVDNSKNQVQNGNLYYFSWAGFFTSIVLLVSYLKSSFGLDVSAYRHRAARLSMWSGLLASSLIVMGSSVRVFNQAECHSLGSEYCTRTKFSISCGVIGVAFAIAIVGMKLLTTSAPFVVEFVTSIVLTILNGFGVAYITSPSGPGSPIGNLYYSMWISFLCCAFLVANCWEQRNNENNNSNNTDTSSDMNGKRDDTEIAVESLEDQI